MATSQQFLICDSSTLANFKQWAQPISSFFTTSGWAQSSDTGQVNWGSIASVPGSGAYVYEVWQPNDSLTNFYVKMEYGNYSGQTNCPSVRITISTTTNGAGTATGLVMGPYTTNQTNFAPPSATTPFECNFSGALGRIGVMLWRNATNNSQQMFTIERSVDSSGAYTGSHVTLCLGGSGTNNNINFLQQSLLFSVGVAPISGNATRTATTGGPVLRIANLGSTASSAFNGSIPFDTISPVVGYLDYPLTMAGGVVSVDLAEGVPFQVTLYSATRTYMPSKQGSFAFFIPSNNYGSVGMFCMRYD